MNIMYNGTLQQNQKYISFIPHMQIINSSALSHCSGNQKTFFAN